MRKGRANRTPCTPLVGSKRGFKSSAHRVCKIHLPPEHGKNKARSPVATALEHTAQEYPLNTILDSQPDNSPADWRSSTSPPPTCAPSSLPSPLHPVHAHPALSLTLASPLPSSPPLSLSTPHPSLASSPTFPPYLSCPSPRSDRRGSLHL